MAAPSITTMIYYQTEQGLIEAADYHGQDTRKAKVHTFKGLVGVVRACSARHRQCRGCAVVAECLRWWDGMAVNVATRRDCVFALAEFRRLTAHQDALQHGDEHLRQTPHEAHRQREQHDPLEQPALRARQERVVPHQ